MLEIKKILFPTDYSACAEQAFSQAAYLAERYGAVLHVLHVTEPSVLLPAFGLSETELASDLHLPAPAPPPTRVLLAGEGALHNAEMAPINGSVERAILAYAAQEDIDLIVMGTHGRRAVDRLFLGSVAGKVVRLAECPVLTVGLESGRWEQGIARRLLVPVDFSEHARLAIAYAKELAATYNAHLDLLNVVEETTLTTVYGLEPLMIRMPDVEVQARAALERMVQDVGGPDVAHAIHVSIGHPAFEIVDLAARQDTDLIVIATHGLTGIKRLLLGSVAERVVHRASCPVFTAKGFGKRLLTLPAASELLEQPMA